MFNLLELGLEAQRKSLEVCRCEAYPFPHRRNGGDCRGPQETSEALVPYVRTSQAMDDAGHSEKDFG